MGLTSQTLSAKKKKEMVFKIKDLKVRGIDPSATGVVLSVPKALSSLNYIHGVVPYMAKILALLTQA